MEYTEKERLAIDAVYKKIANGEALDTETELPLLIEFERYKAVNDAEFKQKQELMKAESDEQIKQMKETKELARKNLELQAERLAKKYGYEV